MKKYYAEQAFISALVDKYGGGHAFADYTGIPYAAVNNAKARGYISEPCMEQVSKKLGVPIWVLNNKHFHYVFDWVAELKNTSLHLDLKTILALPIRWKHKGCNLYS